ncbi:MAG: chemotaxis protein CheA [Spirochaetota bacterium]|nr:chemotaxis protein CheA [Spirochaetota bacterium]
MNLDRMKQTYFAETAEVLSEMEHLLLEIEKAPEDEELINALFRAVHTIKGSSGMFGVKPVESFTHVAENVLDRLRKKEIDLDGELSAALLACHDHITALLDLHRKGADEPLDEETEARGADLVARLERYGAGVRRKARPDVAGETARALGPSGGADEGDEGVGSANWHISLRFKRNVYRNGLDPFSFINYLRGMGEIVNLMTVLDGMPPLESMDPELCYLGFEIDFNAETTKEEIENAFEFVRDDCQIRIIPPHGGIELYKRLIHELPENPMSIGEILIESGTITRAELDTVLAIQSEATAGDGEPPRIGEIVVERKMAAREVVEAALEKQKQIRAVEERNKRSMRIDGEKLDQLINFVGELVTAGENVKQLAAQNGDNDLMESADRMSRLIEEIREGAMNMRMVQIGETFRKFERVVRDIGREQGKEIDLVISGADTELDKTITEKISDPLMHIVRNAIDHGIGTPDVRRAKGRPARGLMRLHAYHETGSIVIEVSDDGDGLDRERIRARAVERGLVAAGQQLTESEILQLIFRPGFSTAEKVTNISGRGVGMDVVKRNIESLRGVVDVESEEGVGTTVRIQLPLTIAIIDGFMFRVGELTYVVPLDMVVECVEFAREDFLGMEGGSFMNLRGSVLPFLSLRDFFMEDGEEPARGNVIVVEYARKRAGLVVDKLVGKFQTVIKPMGKVFGDMHWLSGCTIMGTGEVAYILDVPRMILTIESLVEREGAPV